MRHFLFILLIPALLHPALLPARVYESADLSYDFNGHHFGEKNNRESSRPVGVVLTEDRFGNRESALYLQGHANSYFELGSGDLLKPSEGTVSLWVKLERKVYAGKGYESNPILVTRNSANEDFYDAFSLFYDFQSDRLMIFFSKDSLEQSGINSLEPVVFNQWMHLVFTYDDHRIAFYIDGKKQGEAVKRFKTVFLEDSPVYIGHSSSLKNDRRTRGVIDDIRLYHRVLTEAEIGELYREPNPNKMQQLLLSGLRYGAILAAFALLLLALRYRWRQKQKRREEHLELQRNIAELEMKVVKTQMNPHFISNCLAAIQDLIYCGDIEKAGQYLAKFSLFLRQVLEYSDKTYISLEEELEIIKLNIELEQLRFNDNFEYLTEIAPSVRPAEIQVPSLITQPLVENAIWHGLLPLKGLRKARLVIRVYPSGDSLFIEIEDNGVGRKKEGEKNGKTSKGTKLVKDKLASVARLTDSSNYRLQITDLAGPGGQPAGTRILLQLDNPFESE